MHNNYFFIRQVSKALKQKIIHWKIGECFSQNKNELIIGLYSPSEDLYIKADQNPGFSCMSFSSGYSRARKNSIDLFPAMISKKITDVHQFQFERAFALYLEGDFVLLFKLFGAVSNILLFHNNKCIDVFKHHLKDEKMLNLKELERSIVINREGLVSASCDPKKIIPAFDARVIDFLKNNNYDSVDIDQKLDLIRETLHHLENPEFYIIEDKERVSLSLFKKDPYIKKYPDPLEAISWFYGEHQRRRHLNSLKKKVVKRLSDQIKKSTNYISKTAEKLNTFDQSMDYQQIGDIIMANLHQIKKGSTQAELFDFYHNRDVKIKLSPGFSPQKNAEKYYRKSKNQKLEIRNLKKNISEKEKLIDTAQEQLSRIQSIDNLKALKEFMLNNDISVDTGAVPGKESKFKEFEFMDFKILIGRNSKNNDELTFGYGYKEDLWLHARDVTGSHVLIKYQSGKNFPRPVIEKAAQLAAYYSKNRHMTTCPVIYTEKKYVRKQKGRPPGIVLVDKENILFVDPSDQS